MSAINSFKEVQQELDFQRIELSQIKDEVAVLQTSAEKISNQIGKTSLLGSEIGNLSNTVSNYQSYTNKNTLAITNLRQDVRELHQKVDEFVIPTLSKIDKRQENIDQKLGNMKGLLLKIASKLEI